MASNSKTNPQRNNNLVNVNDVVLNGVLAVLERNDEDIWTGTMTELDSALTRVLSRKNSGLLPGSPSALRVVLNRIVNRLRNRGVSVRFGRASDHTRTRYVEFVTR